MKDRWQYLKGLEDEVRFRRNLFLHTERKQGFKRNGLSVDLCKTIDKDHPRYAWCRQEKFDEERREQIRLEQQQKASKMHETDSFQYKARFKSAKNHLRNGKSKKDRKE